MFAELVFGPADTKSMISVFDPYAVKRSSSPLTFRVKD